MSYGTVLATECNNIGLINLFKKFHTKENNLEDSDVFQQTYSPNITSSHPMYKCGISSLEDFKIACQADHLLSDPTSEIDSNFDYEAEYQKYIEGRGCKDEKELQALNKINESGVFAPTKGFLIEMTAMNIGHTIASLNCNNLMSNQVIVPNDDLIEMCSNMSIEDLASYAKEIDNTGSAFATQVNSLQSFLSMAMENNYADDSIRQMFEELSNNISESHDKIVEFSDKIEEQNRFFAMNDISSATYQDSKEYQALVISKYINQNE